MGRLRRGTVGGRPDPDLAEPTPITILFELKGKTAIVTGGNGGIGLGIARGASGRFQHSQAIAASTFADVGIKGPLANIDSSGALTFACECAFGGIANVKSAPLSNAGADIAVVGRNEAKSKVAAAELAARGVKAIAVVADVTDKVAVISMVERAKRELGRSDIPSSTMPASISAKPRTISNWRNGAALSTPISPAPIEE